ncbi:LysR substrate-binding domain-containing protein [Vibrio salinus]|uniref:LysR substrate-binding domain-containing protein n=1 Tax=Vibrio salinus TaxID=2899784 RepID=UPI001E413661|nr:LysR substrate-binding domain-containing protein [Vibrio salinus]MCE0492741.1 LysR substrate-binding domain-containing protein [Vibrio salinus]
MNRPESLDIEAIRTFVTGIEMGSFSLAAKQLCRSTSAVSAQLKKLELQCGVQLLHKSGRNLCLTESGELLLSYGRRLLSLNDETLLAVQKRNIEGKVCLGLQEDFGEYLLPDLLGRFYRSFPNLEIYAQSGRNNVLSNGVSENLLDYAVCWQALYCENEANFIKASPLYWIMNDTFPLSELLKQNAPVPLVMLDAPCIIRDATISALDRANIPWKIALTSGSLAAIWAAVKAGVGITVRVDIGMPESLSIIEDQTLPELPKIGLTLLESRATKSAPQKMLKELLLDAFRTYL